MNVTVVKTGLLLCVLTVFATTNQASAETPQHELLAMQSVSTSEQELLNTVVLDAQTDINEVKATPEVEPVKYRVKNGDSLSMIARRHDTTWERLYFKNASIAHPDVIHANEIVAIPSATEQLQAREIPVSVTLVATPIQPEPTKAERRQSGSSYATVGSGSRSGNLYTAGYCTWYVKNRRPNLPNNLGNANTWVSRARAQGMATGSIPRVGAVGQQGMHVVYVEKVHANGTVTVSEMNFRGLFVKSTRTVPASTFQYIY